MRTATLKIGCLVALLIGLSAPAALAAPVLTGSASITFNGDLGSGLVSFNDVVSLGSGPEIAFADGSDIGDNVLLDFESLNLSGLTITYTIQGGANVDAVQPGFGDSGLLSGGFVFNNLQFSPATVITGLTASISGNMLDPNSVLAAFSFTSNSVTIAGLEQLLIQISEENTGVVTVALQVRQVGPDPIPEPGTLALMGTGLGLAVRRRRSFARVH